MPHRRGGKHFSEKENDIFLVGDPFQNIYHNILNILDFITGMNDHEAYRLAQELQGHWSTMV